MQVLNYNFEYFWLLFGTLNIVYRSIKKTHKVLRSTLVRIISVGMGTHDSVCSSLNNFTEPGMVIAQVFFHLQSYYI